MRSKYMVFCAGVGGIVAALMLFPMTHKVTANEGGPGPGAAGPGPADAGVDHRKKTIIVLDNSGYTFVARAVAEIDRNWDESYKLIVPNSTPTVNKAIVNLARVDREGAINIVFNYLLRNRPNHQIVSEYSRRVRNIEKAIRIHEFIINNTQDHTNRGLRLVQVAILKVQVTRINEFINALETTR